MNYALFRLINGLAHKNLLMDKLMILSANYVHYLFGVVLILLWFAKGNDDDVLRNRKAGIFAMLSLLLSSVINYGASLIYFEPRPFVSHVVNQLISHQADAAFPSDHATAVFSLVFPVLFLNKRYGWLMLGMAVLVGFSRVYVGVHYPFDIVAGAIFGLISAYIIEKFPKYPNIIAEFGMKLWGVLVSKSAK